MPGDSDAVAALKMRLDRGSHTLEGVEASLRACIVVQALAAQACRPAGAVGDVRRLHRIRKDKQTPRRAVRWVERLQTAERSAVFLVVGFLQLFLDERHVCSPPPR